MMRYGKMIYPSLREDEMRINISKDILHEVPDNVRQPSEKQKTITVYAELRAERVKR